MNFDTVQDLTSLEIRSLNELLESCDPIEPDYSLKKIQHSAIQSFLIISPHANVSTLLSSQKNFNKLQYEEKDVRRGIHLARMLWAQKIFDFHRLPRSGTSLSRMGYHIEFEDVLSKKLLDDLKKEIKAFPLSISKNDSNIISRSNSTVLAEVLNALYRPVMNILSASSPTREMEQQYIENTFVQRLHNKKDDGDVQKVFHSDTFFPAFKFWFFPFGVTKEQGPFSYVPFSNSPDDSLYEWYYEQSIDIVTNSYDNKSRTYGHAEGSFRILPEELFKMGKQERTIVVPENTLVVANVLGFHRRSDVSSEGFRDAIHGSIRTETPFQ